MIVEEKRHPNTDLYLALFNSEVWKDLEAFMNQEREASMKRIDSKSAADLTLGEVCEERGIRKGLLKVLMHVNNRKNGM